MDFHERRRQQFLSEASFHAAEDFFQKVVFGPTGLLNNLNQPEDEPGWHLSLLRGIGSERFERMLTRYTAGEPIAPLRSELEEVLVAYERYGERLWKDKGDRNEAVFELFSIDDYCQLMQLIGLCFLLHRRDLLSKIAALQDGDNGANGGADNLYEEFLSHGLGPETRYESDWLNASKPYQRLSDAFYSDNNERALIALDAFLKRWYKDLAGCGWHDTHKPDPKNGSQAGYYGYWSFEAGAAVILLGIEDDSSLHKYLYYPKDLVAWCRSNSALSDAADKSAVRLRCLAGQLCPRAGFWFTPARVDSRRAFAQGEVMPEVGGDYGVTIWQWDDAQ